jgi:hypothetical protein
MRARETFRMAGELRPDDIEGDHRLASIYQRLGDVTRSA